MLLFISLTYPQLLKICVILYLNFKPLFQQYKILGWIRFTWTISVEEIKQLSSESEIYIYIYRWRIPYFLIKLVGVTNWLFLNDIQCLYVHLQKEEHLLSIIKPLLNRFTQVQRIAAMEMYVNKFPICRHFFSAITAIIFECCSESSVYLTSQWTLPSTNQHISCTQMKLTTTLIELLMG